MRTAFMVFVLASTLLAAGCIPSIHPIFGVGDKVVSPDLQGVWLSNNGDEIWQFTLNSEEEEYDFVFTDAEGRSGMFTSVLTEIEGELFMDIFPKPPPETMNGFYVIHMVPAHTFMKVDFMEGNIYLRLLDFNWLENYMITDPGAIAHEKTDQLPVLTASTTELREFIGDTLAIDGTWSEPILLMRMELDQVH